eukprot:s3177_g1.t2
MAAMHPLPAFFGGASTSWREVLPVHGVQSQAEIHESARYWSRGVTRCTRPREQVGEPRWWMLGAAVAHSVWRRSCRRDQRMSSMARRCKGHRRPLLASAASSWLAMSGHAEAAEEADYVYPEWIRLPLAPYARRRTLLKEVVPDQVWTLDQILGTFYVYVPIRATILKVKGGLLVYAPVAATKECLSMVKELETKHGPVRWILLPSKAVEHKVLAGPFAKKFPDAKFYVAPGQFSVPLDLPLSVLGFPDYEVLDPDRLEDLPWSEDCLTAYVDLATFGEVALLHKSGPLGPEAESVEDSAAALLELETEERLLRALRQQGLQSDSATWGGCIFATRKSWRRALGLLTQLRRQLRWEVDQHMATCRGSVRCLVGATNAALGSCALGKRWRNAVDVLSHLGRISLQGNEISRQALMASFGAGDGSQTLVVTDSLISIAEDPPELLMDAQYCKALAYHARDDATSVLPDTPETRRKGWARIALSLGRNATGGRAGKNDTPGPLPEGIPPEELI